MNYQEWIFEYIKTQKGFVKGRCHSAVKEMIISFPELTAVAGSVSSGFTNLGEHWWCVTSTGEIIDPTVSQFIETDLAYTPWKPGDEVRIGKCMNCGYCIYDNLNSLKDNPNKDISFCNEECRYEFASSINEGIFI